MRTGRRSASGRFDVSTFRVRVVGSLWSDVLRAESVCQALSDYADLALGAEGVARLEVELSWDNVLVFDALTWRSKNGRRSTVFVVPWKEVGR